MNSICNINPNRKINASDVIVAGGGSLDTTLSNINTNISNLTTEVGKKITGSGIANNLTTTTTGYALDATQGKALNDKLTGTAFSLASFNPNITAGYGVCTAINNVVTIVYYWAGSIADNNTVIGTVPAAYKPIAACSGAGVIRFGDETYPAIYSINANGEIIQATTTGVSTGGYFSFTYLINT